MPAGATSRSPWSRAPSAGAAPTAAGWCSTTPTSRSGSATAGRPAPKRSATSPASTRGRKGGFFYFPGVIGDIHQGNHVGLYGLGPTGPVSPVLGPEPVPNGSAPRPFAAGRRHRRRGPRARIAGGRRLRGREPVAGECPDPRHQPGRPAALRALAATGGRLYAERNRVPRAGGGRRLGGPSAGSARGGQSGTCHNDGTLLFGIAAPGQELWQSDGTAAGTQPLFDIQPGWLPEGCFFPGPVRMSCPARSPLPGTSCISWPTRIRNWISASSCGCGRARRSRPLRHPHRYLCRIPPQTDPARRRPDPLSRADQRRRPDGLLRERRHGARHLRLRSSSTAAAGRSRPSAAAGLRRSLRARPAGQRRDRRRNLHLPRRRARSPTSRRPATWCISRAEQGRFAASSCGAPTAPRPAPASW